MNDSRFPVFSKTFARRESSPTSSALLPLMQERRVPQAPIASSKSRASSEQPSRTSRLPKPSSSRPSSTRPTSTRPSSLPRPQPATSRSGFLPSTNLPYLGPAPRTSSLPASVLQSRRNYSVSALQVSQPRLAPPVDPRPHSFPPLKKSQSTPRLPPRSLSGPTSSADDPFKVHASRILRPAASFTNEGSIYGASSPVQPPSRSSSLSSSAGVPPSPTASGRYSIVMSPQPSLRRTATVRSAHRHSRTSSRVVRGPTRKRFAGTGGLAMDRQDSGDSASVYSVESGFSADTRRRAGIVLVEDRDGADNSPSLESDEDLLKHWEAFVTGSSPLLQQVPPPNVSSPSPTLRPRASEPSFRPVRNEHMQPSRSRSPPPSSSRPSSILSITSEPRPLSVTLPRTTSYLHARERASHFLPSSPSELLHQSSIENSMQRVDSEVLLTRMALKRLGSTGFDGDELDKLGRGGPLHDAHGAGDWEEVREEEHEDEIDNFSDRYRDSYVGWTRSDSQSSIGSSQSSGSDRRSRRSSNPAAWKWRPGGGLPNSDSTSSVSSVATSLGSLSRNWSKSSLMEELEREVGRLSRDLAATSWSPPREEDEGWEEEYYSPDDPSYVCALEMVIDDSDFEDANEEQDVPVRRSAPARPPTPPPPIPAPAPAPASRLPRPKPSLGNLRVASPPRATTAAAPPVPSVPTAFVSRLVKPTAVSSKFSPSTRPSGAVKSTRGGGRVVSSGRSGWL
ncbi:hypothetical protein JCM5296_003664 [Sporobolomyces johnsonii]